MYMQSYEGDGWSWGGRSMGVLYEQVHYDCGTWGDYQQQSQQQHSWGETPNQAGPKVGAELLTELRLIELKRLIDRDAKALKEGTYEGLEIESSDSADCPTRAPTSFNEDTPSKEDSSSAHSAPQAVAHAPSSHASQEEAPAPPAPGLDAPEEQCYTAIADFSPETRNYGEMPVCIGEEIFVSGEPLDGWIFGVKRKDGVEDEGWLPASALHAEEPALDVDPLPRGRNANSQSSGTSRRGRAQQPQAQQQNESPAAVAGRNGRKGGGRGDVPQESLKGKGSGKGDDDDSWYQHGNWWSRQRHLKPDGGKAAGKDAGYQLPLSARGQCGGGGSRKGALRPATPPPPPLDEQRHRGKARRGRRSGGKSGMQVEAPPPPRPKEEDPRPKDRKGRQRPALTSMLERLNKPLESLKEKDDQ